MKQLEEIRQKLLESKKPLFFFDDDCDGLTSFIQLYRLVGDGKGICVKGKPELEEKYADKVKDYGPDLVVILDKPMVSPEFFQKVKTPIIWIDHHEVQQTHGITYFNSREFGKEYPTSYICYLLSKQSIWLALVGIVGDWQLFLKNEFNKKYPDLLGKNINTPGEALFQTKLGKLVKIINFNLKGSSKDVSKSIATLVGIKEPHDILEKKTDDGKFIYSRYEKINREYEELLSQAQVEENFVLLKYFGNKMALSSDLSNELLYKHMDKLILIARERNDKVIMSLRSKKHNLPKILDEILPRHGGLGGGHKNACGASIPSESFEGFLEDLKERI